MPQIYLQNFRDRTLEGRTGHYANKVSRPMSFEQRMNDMPVGSCDSIGLLQYRPIDVLESLRGQCLQRCFVPPVHNIAAPENKGPPVQRYSDHSMTRLGLE